MSRNKRKIREREFTNRIPIGASMSSKISPPVLPFAMKRFLRPIMELYRSALAAINKEARFVSEQGAC